MPKYGKNRPQGNASNRAGRKNKHEINTGSRFGSRDHDKGRRPPGAGQNDGRRADRRHPPGGEQNGRPKN